MRQLLRNAKTHGLPLAKKAWKYGVPPLVACFVGYYFYDKLRRPELWAGAFHLRFEWLLPSALLYLLAYTVWGRYYVTLLRNQGATVSTATGLRAYFISQLGKYVPGKFFVIVIRIAMLGKIGISRTAVGITAMFESIVWAGSGAMVGVLLLPSSLWDGLREGLRAQGGDLPNLHRMWLILPLAIAPIVLVGLNRFVNRLNRWRKGADAAQLPRVKLHMVCYGLVFDAIGWLILGGSLMMAVNGLLGQALPFSFDGYLDVVSISSIAFVSGFVAFFMPGGLGVRDIALQLLLAVELRVQMGDQNALVADGLAAIVAIVFRLLGTIAEIIIAGILYRLAPSDAKAAMQVPRPVAEVAHE
jgi:glycosyltransferase 2 family protein